MRRPPVVIAIAALTGLAIWQAIAWAFAFPHYILPAPGAVAEAIWAYRDLLAHHTIRTVHEVLLGILLGVTVGVLTALGLAWSPAARLYIRPLLVFTQGIPIYALAPIFMIWFGFGIEPKVAMAMVIIYFPVTSAFYDGLTNTPPGWLDLARTMDAGRTAILWRIQVPAAVPSLCSGLRLAAVYAPIGAVIGEWVGGEARGLGYLMTYANSRTKIDLLFASLVILATFTVLLHAGTDRLGRWLTARYS